MKYSHYSPKRFVFVLVSIIVATVSLSSSSPAKALDKSHLDSMIAETRPMYSEIDLYEPNSALALRTKTPNGYTRIPDSDLSGFGKWFRYFPMRSKSEPLTTPAGQFVALPSLISGVLDAPIVSHNCTSRGVLYFLLGLYAVQTENELEFKVRSRGTDTLDVHKFITGKYALNGNKTKLIWKEGRQRPLDLSTMSQYTEFARNISNFRTLIRDCEEIDVSEVAAGDLYITLDSTAGVDEGRLAIILDIALADDAKKPALMNHDGSPAKRLFLFGNSLTPATSFHLIRPLKAGKGAWFVEDEISKKLKGYPLGRYFRLPYDFLK